MRKKSRKKKSGACEKLKKSKRKKNLNENNYINSKTNSKVSSSRRTPRRSRIETKLETKSKSRAKACEKKTWKGKGKHWTSDQLTKLSKLALNELENMKKNGIHIKNNVLPPPHVCFTPPMDTF